MIELPHTVVGAAIALKIGNPALALPLALASHFALDVVPHWNPHLYTEVKSNGEISLGSKLFVLLDVGLSLLVGFWLATLAWPNFFHFFLVLAGSFLAVLPDVIKGPFYVLSNRHPLLTRYVEFERNLQTEVASPVFGLATQALVIAAGLWWIFS